MTFGLWRVRRAFERSLKWWRRQRAYKFGFGTRFQRWLFLGNDARRHWVARLQRARHPVRIARRRSAARALAVDPDLRVDPDRGFRTYPPGALPGAADVVECVRGWQREGRFDALEFDRKSHMKTRMVDPAELDLASPLLRVGMEPPTVAAIADYLGWVPSLAMIDVWLSRHEPGAHVSSQLWHCDWESEHSMKLFVYCTDVTAEDGPLMVVSAARSRELRRRIGYQYGGKAARVPDTALAPHLGPADVHALTGPAGTAILVDTNTCLHHGSRIQDPARSRMVAVLAYLPPDSFVGVRGEYDAMLLQHLVRPDLTPAQRLLLGGEA